MKLLRWAAIILVFVVAIRVPLEAQIGVSALSVDMNLPPGGSFAGAYEVLNNSQQPRKFTVEIKDYDRNLDGGLVLLPPATHPRSLAKFLSVTPTEFTLAPGQKQTISFTVQIPSTERGPNWSAIVVTSLYSAPSPQGGEADQQPQPPIGVQIGTAEQFVTKIRRTDPTNAVNRGRILSVRALLPERDRPLRIVTEYENTGTTFQQLKVELRVINTKGEVVRQRQLSDVVLLPGGKQRIEIPVTPALSPGTYLALVIIDFGGDVLLAGQVRVQL
ncbi:MAG: hypothetical protein RML48_04115 [Candidatus Bipolaricaulota bacterium]|nr:hypothetical protein [Candidatus Bipolaricaulota bacterium]